ncbi:SprT-like family-domain-containing protein [Mariannaea sp. PMI_226]|nr:SprT-like family-domain-containing protein [Mariannaea sp. PMI_226]
MARLVECCPSSDDELPDLKILLQKSGKRSTKESKPIGKAEAKPLAPKPTSSKTGVRRVRKLGGEPTQTATNPLFQRWCPEKSEKTQGAEEARKTGSRPRPDEPQQHVLRSRRARQRVVEESEDDSDEASSSEEETLLTRIRTLRKRNTCSAPDSSQKTEQHASDEPVKGKSNTSDSPKDLKSDLDTETDQNEEANDPSIYKTADEDTSDFSHSDVDSDFDESPLQPSKQFKLKPGTVAQSRKSSQSRRVPSATADIPPPLASKILLPQRKVSGTSQQRSLSSGTDIPSKNKTSTGKKSREVHKPDESSKASTLKATASDLADALSQLRLQLQDFSDDNETSTKSNQFTTPPSTPPKATDTRGLKSPSKRIVIPQTPHHHSTDDFWSQDIVDDWNDLHSPRKLLLPPVAKSPAKPSPKKLPKKETKKAFDSRKHTLAESFLAELDREITQGKIAELAQSTGGVKLVWTKTLNTTAGRASWRRETIRTRRADGTQASVEFKHHSSIELAEKVIDDEHRLLNVLAHEFCHLANFMVSGITTNPHGKEFKAWAAKCSNTFADRGINVTTKHSYDIDFKYIWTCDDCGSEFKRHSKSIDPQRHRCGSCKGILQQTKPVPRGKAAGGAAPKGPSRYQAFVKEQMAVVRGENPGSPQKDVMKLIAKKWAKQEGKEAKMTVDNMVEKLGHITLED